MGVTVVPDRRRVVRDRLIAAVIAAAVAISGVVLYLISDVRAARSNPGTAPPPPTSPQAAPAALRPVWHAGTDAQLGAVVSAAGVVAVADGHTVSGLEALTGRVRWTYGRANAALCDVGGGQGPAAPIVIVSAKGGFCSQVETLDAGTGAPGHTRTSPNPRGGALTTGGGYLGWLGDHLVEIWRNNLVRTAQYGDQPNPPNPHTAYTGCTLDDLAIATVQFATIEHCDGQGPNARVVLGFDDPGCRDCGYPSGWKDDVYKGRRRIDQDTGSAAAVIVGISPERVAVLVAVPQPTVVVYDAAGTVIRRTPVRIPAAEIVAAAGHGPTPAVVDGNRRISLVGRHLIAVEERTDRVPAPATTLVTPTGVDPPTTGSGDRPSAPIVPIGDLVVVWSADGALGLPALTGTTILMPVAEGLRVVGAADGPAADDRRISVDRHGDTARIDATAVGEMVIEVRGGTVVGLARR